MIQLTDNTIEFQSLTIINQNGKDIGNNPVPFSFNKTEEQRKRINFLNLPNNFLSFKKYESQLAINTLISKVYICIEDIDDKFKLRSDMTLRIGHMTKGPELYIIINNSKIFIHQKGRLIFESNGKNIEIGRGEILNIEGYEKFDVLIQDCPIKTISRKHAIIVFEDNNWYLKSHPLQPKLDIARERSTWLLLQPNINYLVANGIRDNKIGILMDNIPILIQYEDTIINNLESVENTDTDTDTDHNNSLIKIIINNAVSNNNICNFNINKNSLIHDVKYQIELFKNIRVYNQKILLDDRELFSEYYLNDIVNDKNELILHLAINNLSNYCKWIELIQINFEEIKNVPKDLFNNRNFLGMLIKFNGKSLEYANNEFRDDKDLVLMAIKTNPESYAFASHRLKNDVDVLKQLIKYFVPGFNLS